MLTNQLFEQHVTVRKNHHDNSDLSRLLAAAVVSRHFCNLLLNDPASAISLGYAGEQFSLSAEEYDMVLSARASTLPEFAQHLCKYQSAPRTAAKSVVTENYQMRI
jgi:hypothetical protein